MTAGLGELLPGSSLDLLAFSGQDGTPSGAITVNAAGTAWSKSFPLPRGGSFGWEVKFASSGAVNVKVELEQSNTRPATEAASDTNWAVPDSGKTIFTAIIDTNIHNNAKSPDPTAFGRLKFTGIAGNDATTQCTVARMYRVKAV